MKFKTPIMKRKMIDEFLKKFSLQFLYNLKAFYSVLSGDFAYKNYLKNHCKNNNSCKNRIIFSKEKFLREKSKRKWKNINRCC